MKINEWKLDTEHKQNNTVFRSYTTKLTAQKGHG